MLATQPVTCKRRHAQVRLEFAIQALTRRIQNSKAHDVLAQPRRGCHLRVPSRGSQFKRAHSYAHTVPYPSGENSLHQPTPIGGPKREDIIVEVIPWVMQQIGAHLGTVADKDIGPGLLLQHKGKIL